MTTAIGVASVAPELRGRALATIFGGLTLAQAFGIPLGTWLGYTFGWRLTFGAVAGLTLVAAALLLRYVPRGLRVQPSSLGTLKAALLTPKWLLAVSFTMLYMGAMFVVFTYFTPLIEARYGLGRNGVTALLLVFGCGAIMGNQLGGRLTDSLGPRRSLIGLSLGQLVLMPLLTLTHLPLPAFVVLLALWSTVGWSVHVPQQARLASLDAAKAPVLLALHAAAIYVGGSLGALLGGQTLVLASYEGLGVTGALLVALALPTLWLVERLPHTQVSPASVPLQP